MLRFLNLHIFFAFVQHCILVSVFCTVVVGSFVTVRSHSLLCLIAPTPYVPYVPIKPSEVSRYILLNHTVFSVQIVNSVLRFHDCFQEQHKNYKSRTHKTLARIVSLEAAISWNIQLQMHSSEMPGLRGDSYDSSFEEFYMKQAE